MKVTWEHVAYTLYEMTRSDKGDPEFRAQIRALRPDWFKDQSEGANLKKRQLIELARAGGGRPSGKKHPLGGPLTWYTTICGVFDPEFNQEIRKLRPDWFAGYANHVAKNKAAIMELARTGKPRPIRTKAGRTDHPLGKLYQNYLRGDPAFASQGDKATSKPRPLSRGFWALLCASKTSAFLLAMVGDMDQPGLSFLNSGIRTGERPRESPKPTR